MIHGVEHIGIAVKSIETSLPIFEKLYQSKCYKIEIVETEQVKTAFLKTNDVKIELLESLQPDGVISKFIEKKGEGMHHIAYRVSDIQAAIVFYKNQGFEFINEIPKKGADNKMVVFMHPKSSNGVLTELCMDLSNSPSN